MAGLVFQFLSWKSGLVTGDDWLRFHISYYQESQLGHPSRFLGVYIALNFQLVSEGPLSFSSLFQNTLLPSPSHLILPFPIHTASTLLSTLSILLLLLREIRMYPLDPSLFLRYNLHTRKTHFFSRTPEKNFQANKQFLIGENSPSWTIAQS